MPRLPTACRSAGEGRAVKIVNSLKSTKKTRPRLPGDPAEGPRVRDQQEEPPPEGPPGMTRSAGPAGRRPGPGLSPAMRMPEPDAAVIAARADLVQALRVIVPGRGRDRGGARAARLRDRRPHGVPGTADAGGAAGDDRAGGRRPQALPRPRRQDRPARGRDRALRRRPAAPGRRDPRPRPLQPHPRDRLRQPVRGDAARRHQPGDHPGGRGPRLLLRAPTRRARSPARSAATWPRTPAASTA